MKAGAGGTKLCMIDLESVVWAETCHELKDVLGLGGGGV